jgi:hypothetical protein
MYDIPLSIEQIPTALAETSSRLAKLTAVLSPARLQTRPSPDEWSLNDILAHLRDDYTALNLAASCLMDYTPLITEINEVIHLVVVSELRDKTEMLEMSAPGQAIERTQQAWDHEHVHSGHDHSW